MKRPNVLLVFSDQHRACDLGCYGNPKIISPTFDRFAAESVRLENCIATSPVCVPMRGTMLTGLHAWKHLALTNDLSVDPSPPSLATALRGVGYRTGYIGKWHLGGIPRDKVIPEEERLGFEHWRAAECTHQYDESYYDDNENRRHRFDGFETEGQTDLAIEFISDAEPWALALSWGPPHAPYHIVPERFLKRFPPEEIDLRANVPQRVLQNFAQDSWVGEQQIREMVAGYYAQIAYIDEQFARLLAHLDELGIADDTIVIYTSDHGDMLGSHGVQKKQLPYDESIRVPFMIRWPGTIAPGVRSTPMGLVDLPVTLASLVDEAASANLAQADGEDRSAWILGDEAEDPNRAALIYNAVPCHQAEDRGETRGWYGVATGTHTYAMWDDGQPFCLYDNASDPLQTHNLVDDPSAAGLRADLQTHTESKLQRTGGAVTPWRELIRSLGLRDEWNRSQEAFGREPMA
jgi:arylsulfatase A-like enzyme